jgi:hypothetical protein
MLYIYLFILYIYIYTECLFVINLYEHMYIYYYIYNVHIYIYILYLFIYIYVFDDEDDDVDNVDDDDDVDNDNKSTLYPTFSTPTVKSRRIGYTRAQGLSSEEVYNSKTATRNFKTISCLDSQTTQYHFKNIRVLSTYIFYLFVCISVF